MLSLSTAYCIKNKKSWKELSAHVKKLGFNSLELNVEFPEAWLADAMRCVESGEISISSLHNYCPRLENVPGNRTIYSAYSFTSDDAGERDSAVKLTKKTIDWAKRLGAGAIVVHAGSVPMYPSGGDLYVYAANFGINGKLIKNYRSSLQHEREKKQSRYFEYLVNTLEPVLDHAGAAGVSVGLENRFHYHEMPSIEEMIRLLDVFKGSKLGYWHDTGHAEIMARLKLVEGQASYLSAFSGSIIGCHLQDVKKINDHFAPGSGEIDFAGMKEFLKNVKIKVIEAHPQATDREVKKSIEFLNKLEIS
jgi:sugar phosphate isomerase/epimerase